MEANVKGKASGGANMTQEQSSGFWDWLVKTFYVLPGHPKLDARHSLVYTFNEQMEFFPVQDEASIPIQTQAFWLFVYCVIWSLIIYTKGTNSPLPAYLLGFFVGLIIIIIESYFYTNICQAVVMDKPERPYVVTTPQLNPPDVGQPYDDPNKFIDWDVGVGDYKVILGDNVPAPTRSKDSGYVFLANTFIEKAQSGEISTMDLEDYLVGVESPDATTSLKHGRFNAGKQKGVQFFSERIQRVTKAAYYVGIIVITWAIYVTNSKWGSSAQLAWNITSFMVAVASAGFIVDAYNIVTYNNIIYLRKRLLILAISFGITSIFVT